LIQREPAAVRALDNAGELPLYRLCGAHAAVDSVAFMMDAYEGSVSARRNNGGLPFTVAFKTRAASIDVCLALLRAYPDALKDM